MTKIQEVALAYLLGAYLSDGCLLWDLTDPHPIWEVKDEPFAFCLSGALTTLGSPCSLRYYSPRGTYRVRERADGNLGAWFCKVSGTDKERLPKTPRELVRPLVAGLMDGDGSIYKVEGGYALHFAGTKSFVSDFRGLLEGEGVRVERIE